MLIYIEDFVSNTEAIYRFKLEKEIVQLLQFMFHRFFIHLVILHQNKQIPVRSFHLIRF